MNFDEELIEKLKKIDVFIEEKQIEKLKLYMKILMKWNENINLTAITNEKDIILKHFVDSLTILKYIENKVSIIDIGTGAGFPGIPIKILREQVNVTLMDSLNKRIIFLNDVINKLELTNIKAIHSRAEELARDKYHRQIYDLATSRAVANLSTLSEYMLPFVKIGGKCICMKGANVNEELNKSERAIKELGGKILKVEKLILPDSEYERNIIIIEKVTKTKDKYPRRAGIPSKEPL